MTLPVAWRPESDQDFITARTWFERALADWQTRWFSRTSFNVEDVTRIPAGQPWPSHTGMAHHPCVNGIRLDLSLDADRLWIDAAYSIPDEVFLAPNCQGALKSIAADMHDEWIEAIRSSSNPSLLTESDQPESNRYGAVQLRIGSADGTCMAFVVCDIRHLWARDPLTVPPKPPTPSEQRFVPRRAALDESPVTLSVWLGHCELSAAALATLSVGDVITLDQPLEAPLTLSVGATDTSVATGTAGRTGTALSFQLTSLPTSSSS